MTDQHTIDSVRRADPAPDLGRLPDPRHDALTLLAVADKERAMKTLTPRQAPTGPHGRRWLRPATAFGAALVVVLGAIGVVALVSGGGVPGAGDRTSVDATTSTTAPATTATTTATTAATTSTATTSTPTTTPPVGFAGGRWSQAVLGFWANQVESTSLGLIASASGPEGGVYRSDDGATWELVFRSDGWVGGGPNIVEHLGAVHVFQSDSAGRFVVRSADGATWERIALPSLPQGREGPVQDTASAAGVLCASSGPGVRFLSADGVDWRVVESDDPAGCGVAFDGAFYDLVDQTAYTSIDGEHWTPVPVDGLASDAHPHGPVVNERVLYFGGETFDEGQGPMTPAMWRSDDGRTFERVAINSEVLPDFEGPTLSEIFFHERGVIVFAGTLLTGPDVDRLELVDDPDGLFAITQDADGLFITSQIEAIASIGDRIVMVGWRDDVPHVWIWTPDQP